MPDANHALSNSHPKNRWKMLASKGFLSRLQQAKYLGECRSVSCWVSPLIP